MKQLVIQSAANGHNTFAIPGSDTIDVYYGDTAALTVTVPTSAEFVLFSATGDFYVRWDGSAASIPSADITNGSGSEVNPIVRSVKAGDTFSIIAAADVVVTMGWYK